MRFNNQSFTVRSATINDRQNLANLIHFGTHVQQHLEWRSPLDWLGYLPYKVLEKNGDILAAMACPPDPPQIAWLRLFAVSPGISLERAWKALWQSIESEIKSIRTIDSIVSIPLYYWFRHLLENYKFSHVENVVVLAWARDTPLPEDKLPKAVTLRQMVADDLEMVEKVDQTAFLPLWQTPRLTIEAAFNQSAVTTVAEREGQIIGYQISTPTTRGGHLARLATLPQFQGQGIGYALVRDALSRFTQRGAQTITVNTQKNNLSSLALYRKAGFTPTGEEYPVYQYIVK